MNFVTFILGWDIYRCTESWVERNEMLKTRLMRANKEFRIVFNSSLGKWVVASLPAPPPYNLTFHTAFWFWNLLHLNCSINTTLPPLPGLHLYNQRSSLSHSYIPAPAHQPDDSKPWFAVFIFNLLYIKKDMWFYPKCHFLLMDRAYFRCCVKKDSEALS